MAIHLILHGVNVVSSGLRESELILSNCLGALNKVKDLPPYRIPTQCSHLDVLKNIMTNCSILSFSQHYSHVKTHQNNGWAYGNLLPNSQLNCQMDYDILPRLQFMKHSLLKMFPRDDFPSSQYVCSLEETTSSRTKGIGFDSGFTSS
jgi:hypothetical protein